MYRRMFFSLLVVVVLAFGLVLSLTGNVEAQDQSIPRMENNQGQGNCLGGDGVVKDEQGPEFVIYAPPGTILESGAYKAGNECSGVITASGSNACYAWTFTETMFTVWKIGTDKDCKDISHIEARVASADTVTPTLTPTDVPPSSTPTDEVTPTDTPTDEVTPTDTPTDEVTPTETPTDEVTPTDTPTDEVTPTDTPTDEVTPTDTPTDEVTPTDTPTDEVTPTETPTDEVTPTDTPTDEVTPTETPTDEVTPTDTPTDEVTPTDTPTDEVTPTDTPTDVPSETPPVTPTSTPTQDDPPTATPTNVPPTAIPPTTVPHTLVPTDVPAQTGVCQDLVLTNIVDIREEGTHQLTIGLVDDGLWQQGDVELYPGYYGSLSNGGGWYAALDSDGNLYAASTVRGGWWQLIAEPAENETFLAPVAGNLLAGPAPNIAYIVVDTDALVATVHLSAAQQQVILDQDGRPLAMSHVTPAFHPVTDQEVMAVTEAGALVVWNGTALRSIPVELPDEAQIIELDWGRSAVALTVAYHDSTYLWIVDITGRLLHEVPFANVRQPAFNERGDKLAFSALIDGQWDIFSADLNQMLDGGDSVFYRRHTDDPADDVQPTWYCDYTIYFQSLRDWDADEFTTDSEIYWVPQSSFTSEWIVEGQLFEQHYDGESSIELGSDGLRQPDRVLIGAVNRTNNDDLSEDFDKWYGHFAFRGG